MMYGYGRGYGYSMMDGFGGWMGIVMLLFWLLVIAGIVVLIIWAVKVLGGSRGPGRVGGRDQACEFARMRYAKGEITKEQYEEICQTLGV